METIRIQKWQLWVASASLVVAILTLIVTFWIRTTVVTVRSDVGKVGEGLEQLETSIIAREFTVTHPADGVTVDLTDLIRGHTPFPEMIHYIVITPLETGEYWVQDSPVMLYAGGLLTGRARFGDAAVGAGEQFIVRVLATKATLSPGPLVKVPGDAIFSRSITVTRKD